MNMASPATSLPADLASFLAQIDEADLRGRKLVDDLSDQQANWRPAAGTQWSIVQCLEHMALTTDTYLIALKDAAPRAARGHKPFQPAGWPSRFFLQKTEPPVSLKIKAPKKIQPALAIPAHQALERFLNSNNAVRRFTLATADLNLCGTRFHNPYLPGLNFTIATGLLVIAAHNRRHLWQADRVRQASDFPA